MAYSKAQKLRAKRGRPRLPNAVREANGRKSRRKLSIAMRTVETEKEVKSVAIANRIKQGVPSKLADRPEAGSALGRIHLFNSDYITRAQYEAGIRMAEDYARYYALTGIPFPTIKAHDIRSVRGRESVDRPECAKAAADRIMKLEAVLGAVDQAGRPVTQVTKRVCILDEAEGMHLPHMIKFLQRGLTALATHYGIG